MGGLKLAKIIIEFETSNSAFEHEGEIDAVLERCKEIINSGKEEGKIYDTNGNNIGKVKVEV